MKPTPPEYLRNVAFAAAAAQGGCASVVVVFGALLLGLWLDTQVFHSKPLFTLTLVVISIPVSLFVMLGLVLGATRSIARPDPPASKKEDRP